MPDGSSLILWLVQGDKAESVDVTDLSEPLEYPLEEFEEGKIRVRLQINGVEDVGRFSASRPHPQIQIYSFSFEASSSISFSIIIFLRYTSKLKLHRKANSLSSSLSSPSGMFWKACPDFSYAS